MRDQFDVSTEDRDLMVEIEVMTSLMIAASESGDRPLTAEEIDGILRTYA